MASAYFSVLRRELAAKGFSQAFINNLELILTTANTATTTADTATTDLATLQADVTALQTEVDAIEPDAALLVPMSSGDLPGGAVGQVQYNFNGVFGGFTVSGDGTLDTSTGVFTLATVPVLKGGTGATTASGARTNLGLAIGTDVQAFDSDLSAVAGLATTGLMVRTGTGTATTRTLTAPAAGISISNGDGVSGNPTLALANDLSALEALSGTNTIYYRSGVDTWSAVTFSGLTFSGGVLTASGTSYTADESTLTLTSTTFSIKTGGVGTSQLAADAVTYAKMQNISAASRLLGRGSASGSGDPEEISLGAGLTISGTMISATGATIPTSGLVAPQGRLTLVTGVSVMISDQTAKTHVYYTPHIGATVPIYDGSAWGLQVLSSDLDMALDTSNQLIENAYDLFVWNNSGTISIGAGPAWINTATVTWTSASPGVCSWTAHGLAEGNPVIFTAGTSTPTGITAGTTYYVSKTGLTANAFSVSTSVANAAAGTNVNTSSTGTGTQTGTNHTTLRGTGAGTTELQMLNGIWTNKNSITLTNGAGAGTSVAANRATYVGTIYCTANGQTGMAFKPTAASGGTNNIMGLFNAYNRVTVSPINRDSNADWTYASTTWRMGDNSTSNRIGYIDGLQQCSVRAELTQYLYSNLAIGVPYVGSVLDNTTAAPSVLIAGGATNGTAVFIGGGTAAETFLPQLGFHYIQRMERVTTGTGTYGGSSALSLILEM